MRPASNSFIAYMENTMRVINDFIDAIDDILSISDFPNTQVKKQIFINIEIIIRKFVEMTPTGDGDETACHLQMLFDSGAHEVFRKLYHSSALYHRIIAHFVVRLFLKCSFTKLPVIVYIHYVPVLLFFCDLFTGLRGERESSLYVYCQRTLGILVDSYSWRVVKKPRGINFLKKFYPFVVELAEKIIVNLSPERSCLSDDVHEQFSYFLKAFRREVKSTAVLYPIPKEMHAVQRWIRVLYETYIKLLKKLDESLQKIENFMNENADMKAESQLKQSADVLTVLCHCRKLGKIYEDGNELLHGLISARRVPLNAIIKLALRNDRYLWLLKHNDVIEFEAKKHLVMMILPENSNVYPYEITIDRARLLVESFVFIGPVDAYELHYGLFVKFKNEIATGYGVLREWLCLVCQDIFSSQKTLFLPCPNDRRRFFPNPASSGSSLKQLFCFAGRVVALALMHKVQVGITFDRVFFLQLAGKPITLEDIQHADPSLHMSCTKILDMDDEILDSDALGLTFEREIEELGSRRTIEICHGGKEIAVNSRNKKDFVNLLVQSCFVAAIRDQIYYFDLGFKDMLCSAKLGRLFFQSLDVQDFDQMLGGSEDAISLEDWKVHTEYRGYRAEDQQISWFWKVVEGMQEKQKRILLGFWTSLRYLPVEGFSALESKLQICKAIKSENCLPTSQTCFFLLLLPPYPSISVMEHKLQLITQEYMSSTFGFY